MNKKDASFWSDIKALDERLKREPDSFCFARLSEIYLKVGLVADALHTARTGVARHPGYLAGQRALGMACNASGLNDECRVILEQVTAAMPEDVDAQKILASLYVASGAHASAIRTYNTVLDFRPDDAGSKIELEVLQHSGMTSSSAYSTAESVVTESVAFGDESGEDEIIELSENDILQEPSEEDTKSATSPGAGGAATEHHDPLSTLTLAELYEQQGFFSKALEIYRTILADDPTSARLLAKVTQLEGHEPAPESIPEEAAAESFDGEPVSPEPAAYPDVPTPLDSRLVEPEFPDSEVYGNESTPFDFQPFESTSENSAAVVEAQPPAAEAFEDFSTPLDSKKFAPLAHNAADNILDTLDVWLENIRRIKACR